MQLATNRVRPNPAVTRQAMKGIGFSNVRQYVLSNHGELGYARVLERMSPEDRATMLTVVAVGWYDVTLFARFLRTVDATFGAGELGLLRGIGAFEAEQDFNRVLRVFLRVLTPNSIFRAEGRLWKHFQDAGEWHSRAIERGMRAELRGWAADRALCEELTGYLVRLVQFTGGTGVTVEHPSCVARGADSCVFIYHWT